MTATNICYNFVGFRCSPPAPADNLMQLLLKDDKSLFNGILQLPSLRQGDGNFLHKSDLSDVDMKIYPKPYHIILLAHVSAYKHGEVRRASLA